MGAEEIPAGPRGYPRLFLKYWGQLVVALGLPLVAAVAVEAYYGYRAELEQIKRTQSVQALALATAIESGLQREIGYMARLYRVPWPTKRLERLAEEVEIAVSLFPSILQVSIFDGGNEKLHVSQLEPRRVAREDGQSVAATAPRDQHPRISVSRLGPREIPAILASIPHDRFADERLVMAIDLRTVSDLLGFTGRRDATVVYVIGGDGKVLAHSDPALALGASDMSALAHVRAARAGAERERGGLGMESVDGSGRSVLATVRPVADTDWLIVLERPLAEVVAPIKGEAWRTIVLLAVGLLGAAVLGAALARRFTRPILTLGDDVERIGRGDLAHRTSIRTGDEIQRLGGQVNDMAERLEDYTVALERKVAERTAELEAAMRARALFLAAASHDLRQPLYAISILADTLSIEPLAPATAQVLDKQREAIAVLRALFDNLLDLSRFDAGEVHPEQRVVALRELLAPVVLESDVVCHAKGLEFHSAIADAWVRTDPDLIRRVAGNLLANAVRYTAEGRVSLTATEGATHVRLVVSDTGVGIAAGDRERIFDEFVQLSNPGRDRDKGVGLGLSIVKRICELLGVKLSLVSARGVGTTFSFDIELAAGAARPEGRKGLEDAAAGAFVGTRIWILEDDPLVKDALSMQLTAWGASTAFAGSSAELVALREADGRWPDVAILDDMLGADKSGLEISQWLREHLADARIILVTGNVDSARVRALADSGLVVLRKPLASSDLVRCLWQAMRVAAEPRSAPSREPAG